MQSILRATAWLSLCLLTVGVMPSHAAVPPPGQVRALLFHSPGCNECDDLYDIYLPLLFERYHGRLEIAGIDVATEPGTTLYGEAARRLGLPAQWPGIPTVVVALRSLVGLDAIGMTLGDDFEALAADPRAAHWPELPGLKGQLQTGLSDTRSRVEAAPSPFIGAPEAVTDAKPSRGDRIANALAIVVLAGMAGALVHSLARVRRGAARIDTAPWGILTAILAALGIAGYMTYTSLADVAPVCGALGGCNLVQQSEYAKLFGIPLGLLGLLGNGSILATWLAGRRLSPAGGGWRWLPWSIALFAVLFSVRLTYLEPFVIGHTCLWCLGSAIAVTTLLWLLSGETSRRGGLSPAD